MRRIIRAEDLKKLPTKRKYYLFDNAVENCDHVELKNNIKSITGSYTELQSVSDKITRCLCYAYKTNKTLEFSKDDCDYLYFWL
ncbi:variable surface protein, partial [Plasmodium gonderi]